MTPPAAVDAILFDFDGVIVDSVPLKEEAFRAMMMAHGPEFIDDIMAYYFSHGGTSRLAKFRWIWPNILNRPLPEEELARLGEEFTRRVFDLVVHCAYITGAQQFLEEFYQRWPMYVISGTPDPELRGIVEKRSMTRFFRGVYGSPRGKIEIGETIIAASGYDRSKVWFIGDATTDRDAARGLGVRFVGLDGPHLTPFLQGDEIVIADLSKLAEVLEGKHV